MQSDRQESARHQRPSRSKLFSSSLVVDILLVAILLAGAWLRTIGLNWDEFTHLHPDERFLTMVEMSIRAPDNWGDYFNTAVSTLNPNNVGHTFFVYGTLPIFIVHAVGQWLGQTGYDQIHLVGRYLSGLFDLGTVFLIFLIAMQLYRRKWIALLAAAFLSFAVLPIQLSHFFAVDTYTNFFIYLAIWFAVRILTRPVNSILTYRLNTVESAPAGIVAAQPGAQANEVIRLLATEWAGFLPYAFFGLAFGAAMASKVNSLPAALLLPLAAFIWYSRLPEEDRPVHLLLIARNLALSGLIAFFTFRIFQPYAFMGPGFFGLALNENWLANLRELSLYSAGDVNYPPALQWARRPIWFAWQNMVIWGMGLPLGLTAWAGFLWMGWRIFKGEWRQHVLLWSWTAVYFTWQSINFTRSMRYQMPVYPALALIAAWAIVTLWERRGALAGWQLPWRRIAAGVLAAVVLVGTAGWAFAFTRIYTRPVTRVEASRWIFENVPGPINLEIQTDEGAVNMPLPVERSYRLESGSPLVMSFTPEASGQLAEVKFDYVVDPVNDFDTEPDWDNDYETLLVNLRSVQDGSVSVSGAIVSEFTPQFGDSRGQPVTVLLDYPVELAAGKTYELEVLVPEEAEVLRFSGSARLNLTSSQTDHTVVLPPFVQTAKTSSALSTDTFIPKKSGRIERIYLNRVVDWQNPDQVKTLQVELFQLPDLGVPVGSGVLRGTFAPQGDPRGEGYWVTFDQPAEVEVGLGYTLRIRTNGGNVAVYGSSVALETTWDDPLPQRMDGYDPYPNIYQGDLNFEMYWDDDANKYDRFVSILDQTDYIFMSSNRQWGTTVRVPERYPLTTAFYRNLLGCPDERDVFWCYAVARPGSFEGSLGFELFQVFESYPTIDGMAFNDQFAEEAFSVYDHPKVMLFRKTADYDPQKVREILGAVDLSQVIPLTPKQASGFKGTLMLPAERLGAQLTGGTWSQLFDTNALINQQPAAAAVIWYLAVALLGLAVFPLTHLAFGGLPDRGYAFARVLGMLLLAYLVWLAGSAGIPFSRLTITIVFLLLLAVNAGLFVWQRARIATEWRARGRLYVLIEGIALAAFLLFLLIRLGNPDLWHPFHGGEKPMDFAYLNAVIKSTTFPPYDPWFAGGYINYYYFGFVVVGVLVKWLGIVPSIAYNLILPTLFSLVAIGAFSIAWNLVESHRTGGASSAYTFRWRTWPVKAGLAATVGMLILGNLGTVRMIWHGFQRLASEGAPIEQADLFTRWAWTFEGAVKWLGGQDLPYGEGSWYWDPSRVVIPSHGNEITEFPAFSFLYGDPHAHVIALPITLMALGLAIGVILGRWRWDSAGSNRRWLPFAATLFTGALAVGALRPMNTWDMPTYLVLLGAALAYTAGRYAEPVRLFDSLPAWVRRTAVGVGAAFLAAVLAVVLFLPYAQWYAQGYNAIDFQSSWRTPIASYLVHWGLFLFVIASWLFWETRDWMASTPLSALNKLRPYKLTIQFVFALVALAVVVLALDGVSVAWLALPAAFWAGLLLLRPDQSDAKRAVLILVGSGLFLTLVVEIVVLKGDINRMNTIFKFYLQVWTLLSISAAAALAWLLPDVLRAWTPRWQFAWQVVLVLLVTGAALFPVTASIDKMRTRMSKTAPHTLDGMAYMRTSRYWDFDQEMDLSQDYRAIRWMQENVAGSPVIVEGYAPLYHWGNRFSIYTGLPAVIGWDWHQIQQRGTIVPSSWVTQRVEAVDNFYNTADPELARNFLNRYQPRYIIVGQLERAKYNPAGIAKFERWSGDLWVEIYREGQTVIYEVIS